MSKKQTIFQGMSKKLAEALADASPRQHFRIQVISFQSLIQFVTEAEKVQLLKQLFHLCVKEDAAYMLPTVDFNPDNTYGDYAQALLLLSSELTSAEEVHAYRHVFLAVIDHEHFPKQEGTHIENLLKHMGTGKQEDDMKVLKAIMPLLAFGNSYAKMLPFLWEKKESNPQWMTTFLENLQEVAGYHEVFGEDLEWFCWLAAETTDKDFDQMCNLWNTDLQEGNTPVWKTINPAILLAKGALEASISPINRKAVLLDFIGDVLKEWTYLLDAFHDDDKLKALLEEGYQKAAEKKGEVYRQNNPYSQN